MYSLNHHLCVKTLLLNRKLWVTRSPPLHWLFFIHVLTAVTTKLFGFKKKKKVQTPSHKTTMIIILLDELMVCCRIYLGCEIIYKQLCCQTGQKKFKMFLKGKICKLVFRYWAELYITQPVRTAILAWKSHNAVLFLKLVVVTLVLSVKLCCLIQICVGLQ